ncbi:MAG: tetratricopeptide repeat protein [Candidatus Omnitrophica bacterium]|nr:tetratricopeptide repeat protein [Candidatus Omnitrophota bacterium]
MSERFWDRLNYIFGILAIGVVFGLTAFMASLEVKDLDLWLHLRMGQIISENHVVPARDILSCSIVGKPWVNHEWLFQIIVYQVWHAWGFDGLINMQIAVVFVTFLLLLFLGYSKDRQFLTALFLLLILFIYQNRFTIRPDIYSLLFFVSFVWILSWFIQRRWSLWVLVILQVLWANMHGFFFLGPLLVAVALLSEFLKRRVPLPWEWNTVGRLNDDEYLRLKKLLPLLMLACCVNPLTFKGAWYPVGVLLGMGQGGSKVFFQHITELQKPITALTIWTKQYGSYKAMIILSAVGLFLNRRKMDLSTFFVWGIFLVFSLVAIRNMVFFAIAFYLVTMVNVMSIHWVEMIPVSFSSKKFKYVTSIILKLALMFWVLDSGTKIAVNGYFDFDTYERKSEFWGVSQRSFPYHAVDFLVKNKIKGNFFNDFNSGAYLIGRCYPNIKVYLDGRTEVYGAEFFEHYQKIWRDGDRSVFLADAAKYNLTGAFLNNNNQQVMSKTLKMFYQLPDWKMVYFDYDAVIFLKNIPANKEWIDRYSIDLKKWQVKPLDLQRLATKRIDPIPLSSRAYLLKSLGFYDMALKEAQEGLKVSPDDFDSYKILSEVYEQKGDVRRAFESFRIATLLRPYDTSVRLGLAEAYVHLKNFKRALEQYNKVLEVDPKSARGYFGLAWVYASTNQEAKALDNLKQAQVLDKEDKVDVKKIHDIIEKNKKPKKDSEPLKKKS